MANKDNNTEIIFPVSLNRFISAAGVASRRKCAEMIKNGQVSINGKITDNPGSRVNETDTVRANGKLLSLGERYYIALNKPRGYTCTAADRYAEHKAIELINLPNVRLFSAGRLDKDSEGLLIFSNDGDYVNQLTHPRYGILKTYLVTTDKPLANNFISQLLRGIIDDGELLQAKAFKPTGQPCQYKVVLNEGKKREIRRMIAAGKCRTERLQRVAVGNLKLNDLDPGHWRHLTANERQASLIKAEAVN